MAIKIDAFMIFRNIIPLTLLGLILVVPLAIYAFDVAPTTVDSTRVLLTGTPQVYKFGQPVMKNFTYSDGSIIPSVTMSIERLNQTTHEWEVIGYTNTHLHKLKIDATDKEDLSLGHTDRFNPKNLGPD